MPAYQNFPQDSFDCQSIVDAKSRDDLVALVREAERQGVPVRAVGSGWSFSDIVQPLRTDPTPTPGILVKTDWLNRVLSNTMGAVLDITAPSLSDLADNTDRHLFDLISSAPDPVSDAFTAAAKQRNLVHVEAGIKVHNLNSVLEGLRVPGAANGFALQTLGGSGGQSIAGVVSTSTHGGDMNIPPIPDMVQGIHLVTAGGTEFFIQRGGSQRIVIPSQLAMPGVRVISDTDIFDAVLVSMGRMGIIYSFVVEVREQYLLHEVRFKDKWSSVSSFVLLQESPTSTGGKIADLRADPNNRFLQVFVLPYADSDGDHTCVVTRRSEGGQFNPPASSFDPLTFACSLQSIEKSAVVLGIIAAAWTAFALVSWIPFVGAAAFAVATATSLALTPLLLPTVTFSGYLTTLVNLLSQFDLIAVAKWFINTLLSNAQSAQDVTDLGFKIMDTYKYGAPCYTARTLEVAFDADDPNKTYVDYVNELFRLIDNFAAQNIPYGGYISLRYCGASEGLLAIEQFSHTVCIETSAISGLSSEMDVLRAFEQAALDRGGILHWGQLNDCDRAYVEGKFPGKIDRWRASLALISANGKSTTFDNDFCFRHGLEIFNAKAKTKPDLSFLAPLLLNGEGRGGDLSYLEPLLLGDAGRGRGLPHLKPLLLDDAAGSRATSYLDPLLLNDGDPNQRLLHLPPLLLR